MPNVMMELNVAHAEIPRADATRIRKGPWAEATAVLSRRHYRLWFIGPVPTVNFEMGQAVLQPVFEMSKVENAAEDMEGTLQNTLATRTTISHQ